MPIQVRSRSSSVPPARTGTTAPQMQNQSQRPLNAGVSNHDAHGDRFEPASLQEAKTFLNRESQQMQHKATLDGLQKLKNDPNASAELKKMLDEILPMHDMVKQFNYTPGGGDAARLFRPGGELDGYIVSFQANNRGNLIHELTHAAVNESYGRDFINYPHGGRMPNGDPKPVPERIFSPDGKYLRNEFERQTAQMHDVWNGRIQKNLENLENEALKSKDLTASQKDQLVNQLRYARGNPHREYHTVLNQTMVWMHDWGASDSKVGVNIRKFAEEARLSRENARNGRLEQEPQESPCAIM